MRFLADQDVYALAIRFLRDQGHDVVTAAEWGMSQAADSELLKAAHADRRVFIMRDRDFGALVFVHARCRGVISPCAAIDVAGYPRGAAPGAGPLWRRRAPRGVRGHRAGPSLRTKVGRRRCASQAPNHGGRESANPDLHAIIKTTAGANRRAGGSNAVFRLFRRNATNVSWT